ncbi:4-aminobutyrate--2-oxoglutarate transaminase [Parvibaculum sp.]|uniref:4-aminobutyrate--2-oxoglutarate transaminase n=1 Tax=Parvibaculum sp. TaxID=2024848 RepID=UPI002CF47C52|nr:4-aminobutyrate--2-oxoglutarate transaminase [Parvibaculum sp.]HUD50875.1 4-aminobutyrate--2-oxoglutarate transaminase [Parvibaculum sp.]
MSANADLQMRRVAAVPRGVSNATPAFAARAENAEIWDAEGRRYVDFAAGIAVLNVGHRHPKVIEAAKRQLDAFTHTAFQVMAYEPYIALAERLNALAPFSAPAQTIFFTTGGEAVENAVKIARRVTGRSAVIAFTGAFHGRSLMATALTGKTAPYKTGYGPLPAEVFHLPFPGAASGVSVAESLRALEFLFMADVEPARVAAIIIEPVQGEGGFHVAPTELLVALRAICDRHGILLIADEVQTGFARTGKLFAIEHSGVEPDILAVAKALGGGFPLSGVIARRDILDAIDPGGLGGTYGGSPVSCAAALAVLDIIEEEKLCARASAVGEKLSARIASFSGRNDLLPVSAPRGLGAMVAFDIFSARGEDTPDGAMAKTVTNRAFERGLVLLTCGTFGNTLRILVPLTASDEIVDEGLDLLEAALTVEEASA